MKITINQPTEIEVVYLKVDAGVRYWEDAEVNGVSDSENPPTIPCTEFIHADNEYRWRPIIDIDNGVITNWEKGFTAQVHYKVCDDGIYTVTDKDGNPHC